MVVFYFIPSQAYAGNEGSGPINFEPDFFSRFDNYLQLIKNNEIEACGPNDYAFAVHPDGANDWVCWGGNQKKAAKIALKQCKKKAKAKGCKIFAKGKRIVWVWDEMPDFFSSGSKKIVSSKDVTLSFGTGSVNLTNEIRNEFNKYLKIYQDNYASQGIHGMYFAISLDGKTYGDMGTYLDKDLNAHDLTDPMSGQVKSAKMAIAECMSKIREQCYLYAIDDKIVWQK